MRFYATAVCFIRMQELMRDRTTSEAARHRGTYAPTGPAGATRPLPGGRELGTSLGTTSRSAPSDAGQPRS
jgi:hypothetical protein